MTKAEVWAVFMAVPEAAVDEDDLAVLGQDEVGFAGEGPVFGAADGEAEAEAVEHGAQGELRPGVATVDAGHDRGAFGGGEDIGHGSRSFGVEKFGGKFEKGALAVGELDEHSGCLKRWHFRLRGERIKRSRFVRRS